MSLGRTLLLRASRSAFLAAQLKRRAFVGRAVRRFMPGEELSAALDAAARLATSGLGTVLTQLGENLTSRADAEAVRDHYLGVLRELQRRRLPAHISVKLTQLGLDSGVDVCAQNMVRVLQAAEEEDPPRRVMIDMESSEYVDRTLDLYLALRSKHLVGICLQSYLRRTAEDAERIAGPEAVVRVTKGAYLEPRDRAFQRRDEVSRAFVALAKSLLARGSTVHLATHDERLVGGAREYLHRTAVPADRYEFQMLYGIRRDLQASLVQGGEPLRVYVPYGTQWYPYLTRRLAERPANVWFFVSNALRLRG